MSTSLLRVVERAQQDAEQGPEAIQSNGLRRVSAPPTPTGRGPARSAHETLGRTLQLLRSERQPSKFGPSGSRHATGLAKMAAPSQPAHASHVGAVQPIVGTLPASPAAGCRADMGGVATRHISGGAGWWKSPCPVLVRASGEQSPGATRPPASTIVLGTDQNAAIHLYTHERACPEARSARGRGCPMTRGRGSARGLVQCRRGRTSPTCRSA